MFAFCCNICIIKTSRPRVHVCLHRVGGEERGVGGGGFQGKQAVVVVVRGHLGGRDGGLVIRKLECGSRCVM